MSNRVALVIGVRHSGSLAPLPGAINGAVDFERWARLQGYLTFLHTDDIGNCTSSELTVSAREIIDCISPERLIVFFSGHGTEPTAETMKWLLPGWEEDSNEAIDLRLSIYNVRRSAVRQVAFFADACRTPLQTSAGIGGVALFPKRPQSVELGQIDRFLATGPEGLSQEVSSIGESYGIFTRCLLRALNGEADEAFDGRSSRGRRRVTSSSLAIYLERAVPEECEVALGATIQRPETSANWRYPQDAYVEFDGNPFPSLYSRMIDNEPP